MKVIVAVAAALVLAACSSANSTTARLHMASPSASQNSSPSNATSPVPPPATSTQVPSTQGDTLLSMRMTSLSVMWAATHLRVLRSTDAGRQWTDVTPADKGDWSAFFAGDDNAAWVVQSTPIGATSFALERTTNGGRTWLRSTAPLPGLGPSQITFVDRLHGWVFVDGGAAAGSQSIAIVRTTDGGATWALAARSGDPTTGQTTSGIVFGCDKGFFAFGSASVGLLPTSCATSQQAIYRTADGGLHWMSVNLPALGGTYASFYSAPIFLTASEAVMAGGQVLAVTHDAGATWSAYRLPGSGTVDFESPLSGWQLNAALAETSDGGRTWHAVGSPPFKGPDMTLQYLGKGIGIAWGYGQSTAYRTDDGGHTWHSVAPAGLSS